MTPYARRARHRQLAHAAYQAWLAHYNPLWYGLLGEDEQARRRLYRAQRHFATLQRRAARRATTAAAGRRKRQGR